MSKAKGDLVRLYPTADAFISGVPAVVTDVPREEAERLLAYQPPAFTTDPPPAVDDQQPGEAPTGASSDSTEA